MAHGVPFVVGAGDERCDVRLLPGRAAFLPATSTLLVADVHLGKAATFRKAGMPVPEGSAQQDLARLRAIVETTGAERLLVLGDLFHAASGCTPTVFGEFAAFRDAIAGTRVVLVLGNHDRRVPLPDALGLDAVVEEMSEGGVRFLHDPDDTSVSGGIGTAGRPVVCGHLHPRLAIRTPSGARLTERCFVLQGSLLVLPAFGSFTGSLAVEIVGGTRVWAAGTDAVVDVTRMATLAAR